MDKNFSGKMADKPNSTNTLLVLSGLILMVVGSYALGGWAAVTSSMGLAVFLFGLVCDMRDRI